MIQEDYVSLEIARLLGRKKFNEECLMRYVDEELMNIYDSDFPSSYELDNCGSEVIDAPTLQMTMKWLREVHNLHIMVNCIGKVNYDPIVQRFDGKDFEIEGVEVGTTRRINGKWENVRRGFKTYEEACKAAIKYCLENLI